MTVSSCLAADPASGITVAMAQFDPCVGALERNRQQMADYATRARAMGAGLVVFPELALTGYPPEDLLHKPAFIQAVLACEAQWRDDLRAIGIDAIYGTIRRVDRVGAPRLYNAGVLVQAGHETGFHAKWQLPNYGVFDEVRHFLPGTSVRVFTYRGFALGITVCEDIWHADGPVAALAAAGAEWLVNLNASPYHTGKQAERQQIVARRIAETGLPMLYVNLVGGQDELLFDGQSFAMNRERDGGVVVQGDTCRPGLYLVQVMRTTAGTTILRPGPAPHARPLEVPRWQRFHPASTASTSEEHEIYQALCLGLRDYVDKNGVSGVVLGLSGGIDSALTATIAADALGPERVSTVMMPSPYTSPESLADAGECARRLGVDLQCLAIGPLFDTFRATLQPGFHGMAEDITEENLQPRIRATLLMALANKFGRLLLTTGNKSELAVGYTTLYGDLAGGFSVLKDLLKETVYRLSRARNQWQPDGESGVMLAHEPIPESILMKPPTAELRPGQQDTDSLPPYPVLDRILQLYVEQDWDIDDIVATGLDRMTVERVVRQVERNEYKRRQAPPGVRVTARNFGRDRRYPMTHGFHTGIG
jgi:NAD+ synthase (glutamine-hydrolysing)